MIQRKIKFDNNIGRFIRFVMVGGAATIIHYAIYLGFNKLGMMLNLAYTLGYAISFVFNFYASNYFTFKTKPNKKGGVKFLGAHIINYLLQIVLLNVYLKVGIPQNIAPIGVFAVAVPVNFILVKIALR